MERDYVDVPLNDLLAGGYVPVLDEAIDVWCDQERYECYFEHITKNGIVKTRLFSAADWQEVKDANFTYAGWNEIFRIHSDHCTVRRPAVLINERPD